MVIKSYLGESVAEALKKIRSELGPKAMVLKTRALSAAESGMGKRMVEITACHENPTVGALNSALTEPEKANHLAGQLEERRVRPLAKNKSAPHITPADGFMENMSDLVDPNVESNDSRRETLTNDDEFARRLEEKLDLILERQEHPPKPTKYTGEVAEVAELLLDQDIPDRFVRPLIIKLSERLNASSEESALDVAERLLAEEFSQYCVPDFSLKAGDRALFVGPSGSGKTTALGKFAADTLFQRRIKTELSTLDDFRVAAQEEIAGYSEALGAGLISATDESGSLANKSDRAVLIDCHSNVFDQRQYSELIERSRRIKPTVVLLTISALTRSVDLMRLVKRFSALHPTHLIVTHNDLTETVGGIYTALKELGINLAALTNAPGSLGALQSPDPAALARQVIRREK